MVNASLIIELVKRDYSERFAGSVLGASWAGIFPVVNLAIYILIFGKLMGARLAGDSYIYAYSVYLTVGLLPWAAFAATLSRSTSAFIDKKHLISKIPISLPSLLLYISLSESITCAFTLALFLIFLACTGFTFTPHMLMLPFVFYLQQVLAFGLGLFAATLTVFVRDLSQAVGVMLQVWFWFTPIVYLQDILPGVLQNVISYNPMYIIIDSYHALFLRRQGIDFTALVLMTLAAHALVFVSYLMFRALEKDVRDCL